MSAAVKRSYSSPLRSEHAERTRRAVVAAAARCYVADGYGATTIDAIAEAAGVSRKTVFNSAGGKVELLKLAIDSATVGDNEPTSVLERPSVERIAALSDGRQILHEWAVLTTSMSARLADLSVVLFAAAGIDAEAKELRKRTSNQRWHGARALVGHLAAHAGLTSELTDEHAADLVWLYSDPLLYHRMVSERSWTQLQFQAWIKRSAIDQLLHPSP